MNPTRAKILAILLAFLRLSLSRDALHTYIAFGSLWGLWSGIERIHPPTAQIVVSTLLLSGVVYARTRGTGAGSGGAAQ